MGNEFKYIGYLNSIAEDINDGGNAQVFINNYDYNYVFVLTNYNGWYLQLYHCLPPNQFVGLLSVKIAYWNVSTTNNGDIVFAPALVFCKLIKQISLNSNLNQINISIQGLNDNAGLLVLDSSNDNSLISFIINNIPLTDTLFASTSLAILNDTAIICNDTGCTYNSSSTGEYGDISCAPSPNIDSNNNNLLYNPSDCVELSGFPQSSQVQTSNLVGQIVSLETLSSIFPSNFPLLYFGGSLPPTAMYIYVSSNITSGTANINIYIGETVSSS
jgi:hypothetical protein